MGLKTKQTKGFNALHNESGDTEIQLMEEILQN